MSFEAYSVAIRLRLIDSVSTGLIGMAGQFSAFNRHVGMSEDKLKALEGQLKRIKLLGFIGGAAVAAGIGGLELLSAPLKAAREYELAFTKFKTLNLGDSVNQQADQFARSANLMGVSTTQLMTTMSESVGLFGSYAEAQKLAPKIAQLNAANSAIFQGKIGEIDEGATRALMKFIDRRGGTKDEASFDRNLNLAEKMVTGSGGFIKFQDLATFSQSGGTAFRSLSDEGIMNMSLLLQEQGGAKAGTAMMSIYQNLIAGRTPKKTMELLQDFGFGKVGETVSGTVGGKRSTTTKFTLYDKYSQMLQADPVAFFRDMVVPQLAAHGITGDRDILKTINDMLSNRNASGQASIMSTQIIQAIRDANLTKNAMGVGQVEDAFKKDPNARWLDLMTKYKNLMIEIGEAALPLATKAISGLIDVVQGITNFAREFPALTRGLVVGFGVLSGLIATGGVIALTTAAFKSLGLVIGLVKDAGLLLSIGPALLGALGPLGLVATAIITLGAAGYELYKHWAWVKGLVGSDDSKTDHAGKHLIYRVSGKDRIPVWVNDIPQSSHQGEHLSRRASGKGSIFEWVKDEKNAINPVGPSPQSLFGGNPLDKNGGSSVVKPGTKLSVVIPVQINMDGRAVASVVTKHQVGFMGSQGGMSGFDPSQMLLAPGSGN